MRDLLVLAVIPFLVFASFKRPFIGLGLWLWTAAFDINSLVYGVASSIMYSKLFAIITILSFFISKEKSVFKIETLTLFIILFFIIATLSNVFGIGNKEIAWQRWGLYSKILLFYFFAIAIINKKIHFDFLIWTLIISIGALCATEGLKFLISGGSHRIGDIRGMSGDNNFLGVMIVTLIPLTYYILTQTSHKTLKMGVLGMISFMILGIFSTFSRGAFLGLIAVIIYFWKSSNKKIVWMVVLSLIIISTSNFMPESWISRMNTIEEAESDNSFLGRVIAWKLSTLIAMNNFLGGGFKAIESQNVWSLYSLEFDRLAFIPTPEPDIHFHAAHSLYFQVMGNHGFLGLLIFLIIILISFTKLVRIERYAKKNNSENWVLVLSKMLKISLVAYFTSGAAVSVAYFDLLYLILAFSVKLEQMVIKKS